MKQITVHDAVHAELLRRAHSAEKSINRLIWELLGKPDIKSSSFHPVRPLPVVAKKVIPRVDVECVETAEVVVPVVQEQPVAPDQVMARCTHPRPRRFGDLCTECGQVVQRF